MWPTFVSPRLTVRQDPSLTASATCEEPRHDSDIDDNDDDDDDDDYLQWRREQALPASQLNPGDGDGDGDDDDDGRITKVLSAWPYAGKPLFFCGPAATPGDGPVPHVSPPSSSVSREEVGAAPSPVAAARQAPACSSPAAIEEPAPPLQHPEVPRTSLNPARTAPAPSSGPSSREEARKARLQDIYEERGFKLKSLRSISSTRASLEEAARDLRRIVEWLASRGEHLPLRQELEEAAGKVEQVVPQLIGKHASEVTWMGRVGGNFVVRDGSQQKPKMNTIVGCV